jgi:uncharacterized membrane protein YfhO
VGHLTEIEGDGGNVRGEFRKFIAGSRGSLASILFIIFCCLVFFARGIFINRMSILWDTANQFFPKLWYTVSVWRRGLLPLWNPFLFNGFPTFADPQSQTFYPFTFAMAFLTGISARMVYLQLVSHYMLAGIFMYLFAGFYVKDVGGRVIASLIYMFNGFMINHFEHLTMINSVVWLPLILFFLEKGWRSGNILFFAPAGLCIAFLIFAGHPQSMLYIFSVAGLFALFRCFFNNEGRPFSFFPIAILIASLAFGILLAAVQLVPTVEFSALSNRSGSLPYQSAAAAGQLSLPQLLTFFLPDYFGGVRGPYVGSGDIAHSSIYCCVVFIALIPFSSIRRRRKALFFVVMALVALLFSMGDHGFLFKVFFDIVPGFNLFRAPVQARFVFVFFAGLLTGIGMEHVAEREFLKSRIRYVYWVSAALLTIMLVHLSPPDAKVFPNVTLDVLLFVIFFYAANIVLFYWKKDRISMQVLQVSLVLLTFLDFYVHGANALTIGTRIQHKWFEKETPVVAALKEKMQLPHEKKLSPFLSPAELSGGLFRVYVDDELDQHSTLMPSLPYDYLKLRMMNFNMAAMHRIFMVDGYDPMMVKRYVFFNALLRDKSYGNFLMLSNVKYVVKQDDTVEVLPAGRTMSRAYTVDRIVYRSDPDTIIDTLSDPLFDVRKEAVVEEPLKLDAGGSCSIYAEPRIVEYIPNKVRLLMENDCNSLLVLSDTYYPGWGAEIKNNATGETTDRKAIRVNYCFMGVPVPAGMNEVTFEFNPQSFRRGLIVSAVTVIVGVVILMTGLFIRKRDKGTK